ncbi:hypothetical protein AB0L41_23795 [Amycolatopsis mediterranei]|uniref:hypothetical protein n=1 Tax=Amycolatopsis mediterranei TaxID=33910 RepID=UPI003434D7D9
MDSRLRRPARRVGGQRHHRPPGTWPRTLGCDVLLVPEADQAVLVYSAAGVA